MSTLLRLVQVAAAISAVLAVAVLVWPQWIEGLLGWAPDEWTGATEALLAVAFLAVAVIADLLALAGQRRLAKRYA